MSICFFFVSFFFLLRFVAIFQLIECPSLYELMACLHFQWDHPPLLQMWREKLHGDENSQIILESYPIAESVDIFKEALSSNTVSTTCVIMCPCKM